MHSPKRIPNPLACFLILATTATTAFSADWPKWRGPNENGIAAEALPADPAIDNVLWKQKVGIGFSSVTVAKGRAFTMGHDGSKSGGDETVFCFDATSGEKIWSDSYPAPLIDRFYEGGPGASPTIRGDKVYTYSKHGHLHCYEAASGEKIWQRDMLVEAAMRNPPEWGFACSPYFIGDQLIIEAGATFALNPATGEILWKSKPYTPAYGNPVAFQFDTRTLIAVLKTEGLVVLDAADGKTVAETSWETSFATNSTTPIVVGDEIFISTGYDRGCALFQLKGGDLVKKYENKSMSNHMNNSVLIDGHLYGFDGTAHRGRPTDLVCIEWATGKEKWRVEKSEGLGCGSLIADQNGTLILLTERGELLTAPASPDAFKPAAREQILGGRC